MKREDARRLMEAAIEVMRHSIPENREDGKATPKVGAVLLKTDGSVETAYRGELREGDHAEFTVLERKQRHVNVTGSVLFATLEPCAPDARKAPKLGCAERIVNARISEVWVGIEDPDPTVDRKGIKFLQDNGIDVHMFDSDLQNQIRDENKEFIEQALERAAEAEKENKPKEVKLSELEDPAQGNLITDFEDNALEEFRKAIGTGGSIDTPEFISKLEKLNLVERVDDEIQPTGFGILLFGREPRLTMPQAGVLATLHHPDGREDIWDFDGPQVLMPESVMFWVRDRLPDPIDRSQARRQRLNEGFFMSIREGITNAIIHRDYDIKSAKIQFSITPQYVEVKSPGLPVMPITLAQLQEFNAPTLSRNPVIHYVFKCMGLAEERGLGLKTLKNLAQQSGLPQPKYVWEDPYLVLRLFRTPEAATESLPPDILKDLSDKERLGWQWFSSVGSAQTPDYAQAMELEDRTARRHLKQFLELGLVRRVGQGRATRYEVIR